MNLKEFMLGFAAQSGADIKAVMDDRFIAAMTAVDEKIAALTGQDATVVAMLDKIKLLVDADPSTPEFEQGQNLFTLITTRFAELSARMDVEGTSTVRLEGFVQGLVNDVNSLFTRMATAEASIRQLQSAGSTVRLDVDVLQTEVSDAVGAFPQALSVFSAALRGQPVSTGSSTVQGDGGVL